MLSRRCVVGRMFVTGIGSWVGLRVLMITLRTGLRLWNDFADGGMVGLVW